MDLRAFILLALLCAGPLAGCAGGAPPCATCATPTNVTPICPNCTVPPPKPPDIDDPGYVLPDVWHVGDGWDYLSNQSHFRDIRVVGEATRNGTTYLRVRQYEGVRSNAPQSRTETWMDAKTLARRNLTFIGGSTTMNFTPGDLTPGYTKNGSFTYDETINDKLDREVARWRVTTNVHYLREQAVHMRWGIATGGILEYRTLREAADATERQLLVRQVSRAWLNDLLRLEPDGEQFELVHAKVGPNELSVLDPVG